MAVGSCSGRGLKPLSGKRAKSGDYTMSETEGIKSESSEV